ncbi:unnamed protein product [Miscanthus lutarioriparius]|uniref:Uncharacterized protein n=1 Tax=Miscanthus lutarioriparius TaxID=422564 RepID=A0A811Q409_9POAL|nr:unnamed protein product [Miscanthus lutarioriparius]
MKLRKMISWMRLKAQIQASRGQFKPAVESFRVLLATIQAKKEVWKSTTCSEVKSLHKLEMDAWLDLASIYTKLEAWHDSNICLDKARSIDFFYPIPSWSEFSCPLDIKKMGLSLKLNNTVLLYRSSVGGSILAPRSPDGVFIRPFDQSRLRPKHGFYGRNSTKSRRERNSLSIARTFLRNALRLEPTGHRARLDLGLVLKSEESLLEAADCFQGAYELRELSPIQDFSEQLPIMLH